MQPMRMNFGGPPDVASSRNDSLGASPFAAAGSSGPSGVGGVINGLFETIFGRDGSTKGQNGVALGMMGDFDVDSFVESTLSEAQGSPATGLAQSIGGLTRLFGLGG